MCRFRTTQFTAAVLALILGACSGSEYQPNDLEPGTMEVLSVTPVEDAGDQQNVLPNGSFDEWWAGAPGPSGFFAPHRDISTIERVADPQERGYAVRQVWRAPDERVPISRRFRSEFNLKPDTLYILQVAATNNSMKHPPRITVVERKAEGGYEGIATPLITLEDYPGLFQWYQEPFKTKTGQNVHILAHTQTMEEDDLPDITWHAWRLFELQGPPPALPAGSERPTLYGISNPKEMPNDTITLAAGEDLLVKGWIVGGEGAALRYRINDGEEREATPIQRPDIEEKYATAPVRGGWELRVPADELGDFNSLILQFGELEPVTLVVRRAE